MTACLCFPFALMIGLMRIAIVVFPGVEELDFVAPYEVFGVARTHHAPIEVKLVSTGPSSDIVGSNGLRIVADSILSAEDEFDLIVLPGGAWISGAPTGVRAAIAQRAFIDILCAYAARGTVLASICTGMFILAEAGLLKDRPATTHHLAKDDLARYGLTYVPDRVFDDGPFITSGGVASGLDLALWVVERYFGADLANELAAYIEYPRFPIKSRSTL